MHTLYQADDSRGAAGTEIHVYVCICKYTHIFMHPLYQADDSRGAAGAESVVERDASPQTAPPHRRARGHQARPLHAYMCVWICRYVHYVHMCVCVCRYAVLEVTRLVHSVYACICVCMQIHMFVRMCRNVCIRILYMYLYMYMHVMYIDPHPTPWAVCVYI